MMRLVREALGASTAAAAFAGMAASVLSFGARSWLDGMLWAALSMLAMGLATELLRGSVAE